MPFTSFRPDALLHVARHLMPLHKPGNIGGAGRTITSCGIVERLGIAQITQRFATR
jgi:hypothetical protein